MAGKRGVRLILTALQTGIDCVMLSCLADGILVRHLFDVPLPQRGTGTAVLLLPVYYPRWKAFFRCVWATRFCAATVERGGGSRAFPEGGAPVFASGWLKPALMR